MAFVDVQRIPRTIELVRDGSGAALATFIDETKLPHDLVSVETPSWQRVVRAIAKLEVRGAPALGVAGATALALWADEARRRTETVDADQYYDELARVANDIATTRPTAVNLAVGTQRAYEVIQRALEARFSCDAAAEAAFDLVKDMEREDEQANRAIGAAGEPLVPMDARILTHCNAGSLATVFYGTALGVVYAAAEKGKVARVYADETRPVGQGVRLTAWELARAGVPVTVVCDNMAASLMASGSVDLVVVGADRICANGDVANKIGTYGVAVLARHHGLPFYVAAPTSTIDASLADGSLIPIEQRAASEVADALPDGVAVWNPAFDVTPASLVTGIITEKGVFAPSRVTDALCEAAAACGQPV